MTITRVTTAVKDGTKTTMAETEYSKTTKEAIGTTIGIKVRMCKGGIAIKTGIRMETSITTTLEVHLVLPVILRPSGCHVRVTVKWANPPIIPWSSVWICRGGKMRRGSKRDDGTCSDGGGRSEDERQESG